MLLTQTRCCQPARPRGFRKLRDREVYSKVSTLAMLVTITNADWLLPNLVKRIIGVTPGSKDAIASWT